MSSALRNIKLIVDELGPHMDQIEEILELNESAWAIQFNNDVVIGLEWIPDPDRIVLTTFLGRPNTTRLLEICQALLVYNMHGSNTDNQRFALSDVDGEVAILRELFEGKLTRNDVSEALLNMMHAAPEWSLFVTTAQRPTHTESSIRNSVMQRA